MRRSLRNILDKLGDHEVFGPKKVVISGITYDSRGVKKGYLFVAICGSNVDGHGFISQAQDKGATVVVGERSLAKAGIKAGTTYIKVKDSRKALADIASFWFNNPSEKLIVIGVTGTDGKTTTASLIFEILKESGKRTGLVTTVGAKIGKHEYETGLHVTSPDPISLNRFLAMMVGDGFKYAVVEVTSHGIDQKRIEGIKFDIGVLTNITHEHLDYHQTFEKYRDTKLNFLKGLKTIVINKEDSSYDYVYRRLARKAQIYTYALSKSADFRALRVNYHKKGTTFNLKLGKNLVTLKSNLVAPFNLLNTLAAIAVVKYLKVENKIIRKVLQSIEPPPGRLDYLIFGQEFNIIIDFAHTPNALQKTLHYLRNDNKKGKIIAVFGCAGERDKTKRIKMGEISAKIADISVFTAEDPRKEDIYEILQYMATGAKKAGAKEFISYKAKPLKLDKKMRWFTQIPERGEAIAYAIQKLAKSYDTVAICGKGHEKSMAYDSVEHRWSDYDAVASTFYTKKDLAAVVMAAGEGTRMKSQAPKVLHKIAGRPMIAYTVANLRKAGIKNIYVVVGYKSKEVMEALGGTVTYIIQKKRLGTANAVKLALAKTPKNINEILVVNGDDSFFYRPGTFNKIRASHKRKKARISFVTLVLNNPTGLGRIVRDKKGNLLAIIEEKDATDEQRKIKEINDGLYVFERAWLEKTLPKVKKSPVSGEFYLVSLVEIALSKKTNVNVYKLKDSNEWFGVNTKVQLLLADKRMREKIKDSENRRNAK